MAHNTLRRGASTLGVAGLLALALAAPASARQDKGTGSLHEGPVTGPTTPTRIVVQDDGAPEYFQVGVGALAGMALAGGAALAVGRRHRTHPTPA